VFRQPILESIGLSFDRRLDFPDRNESRADGMRYRQCFVYLSRHLPFRLERKVGKSEGEKSS